MRPPLLTSSGYPSSASLFGERTFAAGRAGFKIRQLARRDRRSELTEQVKADLRRASALLDMLDATAIRTPA
jgi:hypothetical protein